MSRKVSAEAMGAVARERQRQIDVEGWSPEHDDEHSDGEMMRAAMIYLWWGTERAAPMSGDTPMSWPWAAEWWKPKDRRRNLERAGALMLAEKQRLKRRSKDAYVGHIDHKLNIVYRELSTLGEP